MMESVFEAARACLDERDPDSKCRAVESLADAFARERVSLDENFPPGPIGSPGRPDRPELVDAIHVPRRRLGSPAGRAALVHAVAHIEFNAINLALDAVYRFRGMPRQYYGDWLSVAVDEARHFRLLRDRLLTLGKNYGDFPAHNGLWEMAQKTADSCLVRMALVPRVLEARGLDVTPGMIDRLSSAGDQTTVAVLEIILSEEVRHVAIGTHWFRYCCEQENREPLETFLGLLRDYYGRGLKGPFNLDARYEAGFSEAEMKALSTGF
jgi:uncharacterized ferritin-like protein (DUF455 family)